MRGWSRFLVMIGSGLAVGAGVVLGLAGPGIGSSGQPAGPPALSDPTVPHMVEDLGMGEALYVVSAGTYPSRAAAEEAGARLDFGDVQGFYAVPVEQFDGLRTAVGGTSAWALASAFRTIEGAEEFAALARLAGALPTVSGPFESLGGLYAGLGQEAAPDGSGALTVPVDAGGEGR